MRTVIFLIHVFFLWGCSDAKDNILNFDDTEHANHIDAHKTARVNTIGTPLLQSYSTCENLALDMKKAELDKMHAQFAERLKYPPRNYPAVPGCAGDLGAMEVPFAGAPASASPSSGGEARVEGVDFSGTNNQEKGVDEADIIKLDGKFFYILKDSTLTILAIPEFGQLEPASVVNLASPGSGILLHGDRALVIAQEDAQNTRIDLINLSPDRKNSQVSESYYLPGDLAGARRIGSNFHVASFVRTYIPGLTSYANTPEGYFEKSAEEQEILWAQAVADAIKKNEEIINNFDFLTLVPRRFMKNNEKLEPLPLEETDCAQTYSQQQTSENGFLNLISLVPNNNKKFDVNIQRIRGNEPLVYASNNQFILASRDHDAWWFLSNEDRKDETTIHRFDLGSDNNPIYQDSVQKL